MKANYLIMLIIASLLVVAVVSVPGDTLVAVGKRGLESEVLPLSYWITPDEVESLASELASKPGSLEIYLYVISLDVISDGVDYWQLPIETIERGGGDCEDLAFLLHSLFLAAGYDSNLVIGKYDGGGHVWVVSDNLLYETTKFRLPSSEVPGSYSEEFRIVR